MFHIPKGKTSRFGSNTLRYDGAKLWHKFYHAFLCKETDLTKSHATLQNVTVTRGQNVSKRVFYTRKNMRQQYKSNKLKTLQFWFMVKTNLHYRFCLT